MPIIKSGFQPGFRGRHEAPTWNRRAHYLASQQDRDSGGLLEVVSESSPRAEDIARSAQAKLQIQQDGV